MRLRISLHATVCLHTSKDLVTACNYILTYVLYKVMCNVLCRYAKNTRCVLQFSAHPSHAPILRRGWTAKAIMSESVASPPLSTKAGASVTPKNTPYNSAVGSETSLLHGPLSTPLGTYLANRKYVKAVDRRQLPHPQVEGEKVDEISRHDNASSRIDAYR